MHPEGQIEYAGIQRPFRPVFCAQAPVRYTASCPDTCGLVVFIRLVQCESLDLEPIRQMQQQVPVRSDADVQRRLDVQKIPLVYIHAYARPEPIFPDPQTVQESHGRLYAPRPAAQPDLVIGQLGQPDSRVGVCVRRRVGICVRFGVQTVGVGLIPCNTPARSRAWGRGQMGHDAHDKDNHAQRDCNRDTGDKPTALRKT